jgi:hypothetical protein
MREQKSKGDGKENGKVDDSEEVENVNDNNNIGEGDDEDDSDDDAFPSPTTKKIREKRELELERKKQKEKGSAKTKAKKKIKSVGEMKFEPKEKNKSSKAKTLKTKRKSEGGDGEGDDGADAVGAIGGAGGDRGYGCGEHQRVAFSIADEEIKIAVAVDIGQGRSGIGADICNPEGIGGWIAVGGSCGTAGVGEHQRVAGAIADEEIKIAVAVEIGQGWGGLGAHICNPEGIGGWIAVGGS